jgi:hypothetical protein
MPIQSISMTDKATRHNKTIALVEWNWMGHHPSYTVQLALAISNAGMNVVPFCANSADFQKRLTSSESQRLNNSGTIHPANQIQRADSRVRWPRDVIPIGQAINHFGILGKQLRRWNKRNSKQIDQVFSVAFTIWTLSIFAMPSHCFASHGRAYTSIHDSFVYRAPSLPIKLESPAQRSTSPCLPALG